MNIIARILLILVSIGIFLFIMIKIRKKRIHVHYAIYWTFLTFILVIVALFPQLLYLISDICGVEVPVHILLMGIIFLLIIKTFNDTIRISELERKVESLTQNIAVENADAKTKKNL